MIRDEAASDAGSREHLDALSRFRPGSWESVFDHFSRLDPHFARMWSTYTGGLLRRQALDVRTRLLVAAGQYTMLGDELGLRDTISAAVAEEVDLKEVLEAILQCWVYVGERRVLQATHVFDDVVDEAGLLEGVRDRGVPSAMSGTPTSAEQNREAWSAADLGDPRLEELAQEYGWGGLGVGLRLRPGVILDTMTVLDALNPAFAASWLNIVYGGMYARGVLDDRTRLLCMVGDCMAIGERFQGARHMRGALRQGATPKELLEIVLRSCAIVGHPFLMGVAIDDLVTVVDDEGRLEELVASDKIDHLRDVVRARVARRNTVGEMKTE